MLNYSDYRKTFNEEKYDRYSVKINLKDIVGGIPTGPMLDGWLRGQNDEFTEEQRKKIVDATLTELPELSEDEISRHTTVFKQNENGAYFEGRCVKSGLKEAANVIKGCMHVKDKKGTKKPAVALKAKTAECVFVYEDILYFTDKDGNRIKGDLPKEEKPINVSTAQGKRQSIKRYEILRDVNIEFTIRLLKTGAITEEILFAAIAYLEQSGLGSDRAQGHGKFTAEVKKIG